MIVKKNSLILQLSKRNTDNAIRTRRCVLITWFFFIAFKSPILHVLYYRTFPEVISSTRVHRQTGTERSSGQLAYYFNDDISTYYEFINVEI